MTKSGAWGVLVVAAFFFTCSTVSGQADSVSTEIHELKQTVESLKSDLNGWKDTVESLTRQVMLQQLFVEEKIRSDGDSGLKQIRHNHDGTRPYFAPSHSESIASIHEHSNNDRTVGMGEMIVVLNGVEFRTRHNDYRLRMPSKTSKHYGAMDNIPFPDVPPEVLHKATVQEQITEMREWFKAWKNQDHSVRDYRKYFKPILCYMEGTWTKHTKKIHEPFFSDRHHIDASSWFDLQEKVRFTSYAGSKSNLENFAYLPTTIMNVVNGTPEYAQWNYRIACHPLKDDLPTKVFLPVDDLKVRMTRKMNMTKYATTRSARFVLEDKIYPPRRAFHHKSMKYGLLDSLMSQIPGKDNYLGHITDDAFGLAAYDIRFRQNFTALNTAFYHRWYKVTDKGAMGLKVNHRGFADENLFVAQTTQPEVALMTLNDCKSVDDHPHAHGPHAHHHFHTVCNSYSQRYTYAIPLEIIYMTPLSNWNPYNLELKGQARSALGKTVTQNGRNGELTKEMAYNGTSSKVYYLTPAEFYSGGEVHKDAADTSKGAVGVLGRHGEIKKVVATGTRIFLPDIPGVGVLRQRYPIMPIHGEGSGVWKELDALKDMVMDMPRFGHLFEHPPTKAAPAGPSQQDIQIVFETTRATSGLTGPHTHFITITWDDFQDLLSGHKMNIFTSIANGHQHDIDLVYDKVHQTFDMASCDGDVHHCWDGHVPVLHITNHH